MKLNGQLCCPSCAAMFRPLRDEDICPKCTLAEETRLAEIDREQDGDPALDEENRHG